MIYQNQIIESEGQKFVGTVVQFGTGDIGIMVISCNETLGLSFHNIEAREIGSRKECDSPAQTLITFSNIESLNVVLKNLKEVKKRMLKLKDEKPTK